MFSVGCDSPSLESGGQGGGVINACTCSVTSQLAFWFSLLSPSQHLWPGMLPLVFLVKGNGHHCSMSVTLIHSFLWLFLQHRKMTSYRKSSAPLPFPLWQPHFLLLLKQYDPASTNLCPFLLSLNSLRVGSFLLISLHHQKNLFRKMFLALWHFSEAYDSCVTVLGLFLWHLPWYESVVYVAVIFLLACEPLRMVI